MKNEITILRKISHPNILKLYCVYDDKKGINLVTEYLSGGSLQDYIKHKGVLTECESLILLEALLKIVDYLSNENIIHRDIKPENIMLRRRQITLENIVLIDFGLATYFFNCPKELRKCGSPGFIPPEILNPKAEEINLTYKSDVFSIGITWYYSLSGHMPYRNKSKEELLYKNKHSLFEFETSNKFRKFENALKQLIEKDPKKRLDARSALNTDFLINIQSIDEDIDEVDGGRLFENISNFSK